MNIKNRRLLVGAISVAALSGAFVLIKKLDVFNTESSSVTGGAVLGYFSVDPSGGAEYTIPVGVPPGTVGLAPKLSLVYNSKTKNGIVGMGFDLKGILAIERSGATPAQDGFKGGVNYDTADRFTIEGERMMLASGSSYGSDGSEYRTELETWQKITAKGSCGSGPCSFTVVLKDGSTLEYGNTSDSRILAVGSRFNSGSLQGSVRTWLLNKITDLNGNSLTITYTTTPTDVSGNIVPNTQGGGQPYPDQIDYTMNNGLSASRSIRFYYEARSDSASVYEGGAAVRMAARLTNIRSYVKDSNGKPSLVVDNQLSYDPDAPLSASRLLSVSEVGADGTTVPPMKFNWSNGPNTLVSQKASWGGPGNNIGWVGDFNGDGLTDIISNSTASNPQLFIANGSGFNGSQSVGINFTSYSAIYISDFNGDGLADILGTNSSSGGGLYFSNGNGFGSKVPLNISLMTNNFIGDFNGDGRADLFTAASSTGTMYLADGNGFGTGITVKNIGIMGGSLTVAADFNGDGLADLLSASGSSGNVYFSDFSKGNSFKTGIPTGNLNIVSGNPAWTGDFNGDGLADIMTQAGSTNYLNFSNGNGFQPSLSVKGLNLNGKNNWPGDFNGDGITDLYSSGPSSGNIYYFYGSMFTASGTISNTNLLINNSWLGDFNGDGMTDLFAANASSPTLYFSGNNGTVPSTNQTPNLLTKIDNGIGGLLSIQYKPLTDGSVYSKDIGTGSSAQVQASQLLNKYASVPLSPVQAPVYPVQDIQDALYVVASYTNANNVSVNGSVPYTYTYFYRQGLISLNGRGFLGFESKSVSDASTNTLSVSYFNQTFPFTGLVDSSTVSRLSDKALLTRNRFMYDDVTAVMAGSTIYQVRKRKERVDNYNYGTYKFTLAADYGYDAYGNVTSLANLGDSTLPQNAVYTFSKYDNNTDKWQLGYLTSKKVTSDAQGSKMLSYDSVTYYSETRNIQTSSSWDNQQNAWLTTGYKYDAYGNRITQTSPSGDITTFVYDASTDYTFPSQVISPPNMQGKKLTSSAKYELAFGTQIQTTDPNGVTLEKKVDGLGRITTVKGPGPNGDMVVLAKTQWVLTGQNGYYTESQALTNWSGNEWSIARTYTDGLLRNYRTTSFGTGGNNSSNTKITDTWFDSEGRVIRQSLPYYDGDPVYWSSQTYDPYGRIIRMVQPKDDTDSTVTQISYDGYWVTTQKAVGTKDAVQTKTQYQYFNSSSQSVTRIAEDGSVSNFYYDPLGRATGNRAPLGIKGSVTYNTISRKTTMTDPSLGFTQYNYNDFTRTTTQTDANNNTIVNTYDALGRLIAAKLSDTDSVLYQYDDPTYKNSQGRLSKVTIIYGNDRYSYGYTYDAYGNTASDTLWADNKPYATSYTYTPNHLTQNMVYPDGSDLQTTYTLDGDLDSLNLADKQGGSFVNYAAYGNYTATGLPQQLVYKNGVRTDYTYYALGNLKQYAAVNGSSKTLESYTFNWNYLAQVTQIQDKVNSNYTENFFYDPVGRLDSANGIYGAKKYDYDSAGNVTLKDGVLFTYQNYQVQGGSGNGMKFAFKYGSTGNMQQKVKNGTATIFNYDAVNRINSVTRNDTLIYKYVYDHTGRRMKKIDPVNKIVTLYVNSVYEVTQSSSGTLYTKYIPGVAGNIASVTKNSSSSASPKTLMTASGGGVPTTGTLFFHQDYRRNTHLVTDDSGNVQTSLWYEPYGTIYDMQGLDNFRPKFIGKEDDENIGIYYLSARYYDPETGRFLTADPGLGGPPNQSDVFNRYAYALNNPTNYVDPTGHSAFSAVSSLIISGAEILAGIALDVVSGGAAANLGGALIGAGIGGATYTATHFKNFSWKDFGIQQAIGAVTGALTDGTGSAEEAAGQTVGKEGGIELEDMAGQTAGKECTGCAEGDVTSAGEKTGCFTEGTEVASKKGPVPIEKIQPGDSVWSYDETSGMVRLNKVVKRYPRTVDKLIIVKLSNETIETTTEHPFWVKGAWMAAENLRAGDVLTDLKGKEVKVQKVEVKLGKTPVYNFEVENAHSYYVSEQRVLVHNTCYRLDFYKRENIIGYTGDIDDNPTVYFRDANNNFGRITQYHNDPSNIGRNEIRQYADYRIENVWDNNVSGPRAKEYYGGRYRHTSRNLFHPVDEDNIDQLAEAIDNFRYAKTKLLRLNLNNPLIPSPTVNY